MHMSAQSSFRDDNGFIISHGSTPHSSPRHGDNSFTPDRQYHPRPLPIPRNTLATPIATPPQRSLPQSIYAQYPSQPISPMSGHHPITPPHQFEINFNSQQSYTQLQSQPASPAHGAYRQEQNGSFPLVPRPMDSVQRMPTRRMVSTDVPLENGNYVIDVLAPLSMLEGMPYQTGEEFEKMRYTACTASIEEFPKQYTLRQGRPGNRTRIAVVVTMYNEDDVLLCKSLTAIMKNISYLCSSRVADWREDSWKEVVVVIVSDGRAKCNDLALKALGVLGCYTAGMCKASVNGKAVTAHIFEYTTQLAITRDLAIRRPLDEAKDGLHLSPMRVIFLLKERNAKKINSHRWFFSAVCEQLNPDYCILIDVGTKPSKESFLHLYREFERDENVAGVCGEITAELGSFMMKVLNPIVAIQNFEYKMSNILDKPLESVCGYISVLPGAFSGYRFKALKGEPFDCYFKGEEPHGANVKEANMYLAEDRILCSELVLKKYEKNVLKYVKSARAETDVPDTLHGLIKQRRRWLNGTFFASVHATKSFMRIFQTQHSFWRKFILMLEFFYNGISLLFSWFNLGNFFLSFHFLLNVDEQAQASCSASSDCAMDPYYSFGAKVFPVFQALYILSVATAFIVSLGNRPEGAKILFLILAIVFAIFMAVMVFVSFYTVILSVNEYNKTTAATGSFGSLTNVPAFRDLVVSLMSTFGLYFVSSVLFLDAAHIFTCMVQYFFMIPNFINIFMVFAFCNLQDVSWGTKGPDVASDLGRVVTRTTRNGDNVATVEIPSGESDADVVWNQHVEDLAGQRDGLKKRDTGSHWNDGLELEDHFKQFRTWTLLWWLSTNGLLVYFFTNPYVAKFVFPDGHQRMSVNPYLTFLFWSVAILALVRFVGTFVYWIGWMADGAEE
ncbi:Chitin synthase, class 2 [Phlyctochytrium planicorne]|nr:Chitin synthase, class 2 [Phlyctochytrium planicorne]